MKQISDVEAIVVIKDCGVFYNANIMLKSNINGDILEETVFKEYFEQEKHSFYGDFIATRFVRDYDMDIIGEGYESGDEEYKYVIDCDESKIYKYAYGWNGSQHPILTLVDTFTY